MKKYLLIFGMVLAGSNVFAHELSRAVIDFGTQEEIPTIQAGNNNFQFDLIDTENKTLITPDLLAQTHTKFLHVFVFDAALKEFKHVHPEFIGSKWQVSVDVPVNGKYWIWAQGQLKDGNTDFTGPAQFEVTDGSVANPDEPVLNDIRTGADGISQASISSVAIKANQSVALEVTFSRTDGTTPVITPYLGDVAHLVCVPSDGDSLIHVHPMLMNGKFMIHTSFPEAGNYRIWVQYVDGGILRVVPLSVLVTI